LASKINKEDIKVKVFDAYHEYIRNHYPDDPNIYVIRAHPETVSDLMLLSAEYQTNVSGYDWVGDGADRFLVFRLIADFRLPPGDILFGPESIEIKWSK
jgi:hypothetical protein